jgi:hypothetical protein
MGALPREAFGESSLPALSLGLAAPKAGASSAHSLETKCPPRLLRYCPAASCEANPIHQSGGQFLVERRAAEGGFGSSKRFALFDHGFTALRL